LFRAARSSEYRAIARRAERLLYKLEQPWTTGLDLARVEAELVRLHRWTSCVHAREYFGAEEQHRAVQLLHRCDKTAASYLAIRNGASARNGLVGGQTAG